VDLLRKESEGQIKSFKDAAAQTRNRLLAAINEGQA